MLEGSGAINKVTWLIITILATSVAGYAIVQYFIMDGYQSGLVQMKLMFLSKLSALWYIMLFIHIATSVVALVIGPFTLSTKFREKNIDRHRKIGKTYMIGILFGGI